MQEMDNYGLTVAADLVSVKQEEISKAYEAFKSLYDDAKYKLAEQALLDCTMFVPFGYPVDLVAAALELCGDHLQQGATVNLISTMIAHDCSLKPIFDWLSLFD